MTAPPRGRSEPAVGAFASSINIIPVKKDYSQPYDRLRDDCPVKAAIDVIRGRWKPSILYELSSGTKRFCDLQTALPAITAQVLTVQLRQLEADGVVARTVYAEVPARVEYSLTDLGGELSEVMDALERWGVRYREAQRPEASASKPHGRANRSSVTLK